MIAGLLPLGSGLVALAIVLLANIACRVMLPGRVLPTEKFQDRAQSDLAQMGNLLSALPDPVVLLKSDGRIVCFNAAAQALSPALRPNEPISLAVREPEVLSAIRAAVAEGAAQKVEFTSHAPERWWEACVAPVPQDSGENDISAAPQWVLLSLRDLTPMRRVEEMRVDFVANVSHELRTPLATLSGFIDTLKGPAREDKAARERFLDIMQTQAERMARLIGDLLSLSRIELAAHQRPTVPVEIAPLIHQVSDALQPLAVERGVAIIIHEPDEKLIVAGDRDELIRALENLMENALKYGGSGERVEISLTPGHAPDGGREARIEVRDFGPGIPEQHLPRLTERFYRVDIAGSRAQGGTGLGLALVKHILNHHGGRLSIESRIGAGARFTMHLPVLANPPA